MENPDNAVQRIFVRERDATQLPYAFRPIQTLYQESQDTSYERHLYRQVLTIGSHI